MSNSTSVWMITGASAGLGKAFAEHALEAGCNVVVTARTAAKLTEIAALNPDRVLAIPMDVNHAEQVRHAVARTVEHFGRLDVLINNAGYGTVGAVEETPDEELRAQMETNFFGAVAMIRAALPVMRSQRDGAIVNISSMGGQVSFAGFGAYSASKFALEGISEALAHELKPLGIRVMIVEPGAFRTDFAGSALKHMPRMPDYEVTVGVTRDFAQGMHQTQSGDPAKAARAVALALREPNPPLRLALGQDAVQAIRSHAESLLAELKQWEPVALDTRWIEEK